MVPSVSLGKYLSERANGLNYGLLAKNKQANKNKKARIRPFPIVLVKCWKVAHWNARKLLKNVQNPKSYYLSFKSCHENLLIILY